MQIRTKNFKFKEERKEIVDCVRYMYSLLVPKSTYDKTIIIVESHKFRKEQYAAVAVPNKKNIHKYRILINQSLNRKKRLVSIAHELVHIKQWELGELGGTETYTIDGKLKKRTIWNDTKVVENDSHYYDWPWEIEAHGREYGLYYRYKERSLQMRRASAARKG